MALLVLQRFGKLGWTQTQVGQTADKPKVAPISRSLMLLLALLLMEKTPISEGLLAASGKGKFQPDNKNSCKKYNDSDDDQLVLGFDKKRNHVYMKYCKVAESKDKKTDKTDTE